MLASSIKSGAKRVTDANECGRIVSDIGILPGAVFTPCREKRDVTKRKQEWQ
jgi:hypothetical protein